MTELQTDLCKSMDSLLDASVRIMDAERIRRADADGQTRLSFDDSPRYTAAWLWESGRAYMRALLRVMPDPEAQIAMPSLVRGLLEFAGQALFLSPGDKHHQDRTVEQRGVCFELGVARREEKNIQRARDEAGLSEKMAAILLKQNAPFLERAGQLHAGFTCCDGKPFNISAILQEHWQEGLALWIPLSAQSHQFAAHITDWHLGTPPSDGRLATWCRGATEGFRRGFAVVASLYGVQTSDVRALDGEFDAVRELAMKVIQTEFAYLTS